METAIAMIADPHFHDIHYRGVHDGPTIRSFRDTISQSRILNESYFSLRAALDDVVQRGIKIVVMPGDLTEDGQPADIDGFIRLTDDYREKHGMRFFATFGNHDAYGPTGKHFTKTYTAPDGERFTIASTAGRGDFTDANMKGPGYAELMQRLADFGFFRRDADLHWETPFGADDAPAKRTYTALSDDGRNTAELIDASYLVEPVEGLWLLALDSNVYQPKSGGIDPGKASSYVDSKVGKWDAVVRHRPYLLDWMADVRRRADAEGKALVVFSHYPVVAAPEDDPRPAQFNGAEPLQPAPETTAAIARTGIGVHFSGHEHVCNIGRYAGNGHTLVDVALPAVCSFPPAFRVLTCSSEAIAVETVAVTDAPGIAILAETYRREAEKDTDLAEAAALLTSAEDFGDFMSRQLGVAVRGVLAKKHFGKDFAAHGDRPLADGLKLIDALADWYRLSRGGEIARAQIPAERLAVYAHPDFALRAEGDVRRMMVQLQTMAAAPYASVFTLEHPAVPER
jgi:3',5'-cyclic AMP phosphodiesterase CpdA